MCDVCVCGCMHVVYVCTHLLKVRAEATPSLAPSALHCTMHYKQWVFGRSVHLIALTVWVLALMEWKEITFMLNLQIQVTTVKKGTEEFLSEQNSHPRFLCEVPPTASGGAVRFTMGFGSREHNWIFNTRFFFLEIRNEHPVINVFSDFHTAIKIFSSPLCLIGCCLGVGSEQ